MNSKDLLRVNVRTAFDGTLQSCVNIRQTGIDGYMSDIDVEGGCGVPVYSVIPKTGLCSKMLQKIISPLLSLKKH